MQIKSLTQKIIVSFLVVLLLMTILGLVSYHAFIKMDQLSEDLTKTLLLDMFLDESMGSHRKWMNNLAHTLLLDTEFRGNLDTHQCEFGRWFYTFLPPNRKIRTIHSQIEKPHRILHESAKEIVRLHRPADPEADHMLIEKKNNHTKWVHDLAKALKGEDKNLIIHLKEEQCDFIQWDDIYLPKDREIEPVRQSLQEFHLLIDTISKQIFRMSRQGRWKEAREVYHQQFLRADAEFLDSFSRMETLISQRVKNNRQAVQIYTSRTIPAMEELQKLVNLIRVDLMSRIDKLDKEYQWISKRTRSFIIWSILLIIFLTILCILLIPSHLTRPIRHLTQFANRIATEGDLSETLQIENQDEIGQLARSFNGMIQALRTSKEELEGWGKTLEQKVASRTEDLEETYRQLEMTQTRLVQSSKLASIGELAAGMAHEINNPMNIITGYAELLLDEVKPGTEAQSYVKGIVEAGQRISIVIKNLLIFARQDKQEYTDASITGLIEQALSFMQKHLEKEGIRIERDYESDLPPIRARSSQLEQVFLNLIMNAKDALLEKGGNLKKLIRIQVRTIQENHSPFIRITFRDTGAGIKPENMDRIFDPFFTTKREDKGTGLGLSISYGIIKDHRGNIQVESRVGESTTFVIDLPLKQPSFPHEVKRDEHERYSYHR